MMNVTVDASELATLVKDAEAWRKTQEKRYKLKSESPLNWLVDVLSSTRLFDMLSSNGKGGATLRHTVTGHSFFLSEVLWEEER